MTRTAPKQYVKQVAAPYSIVISRGRFTLKKGRTILKRLHAQSENGADREAMIFLKAECKGCRAIGQCPFHL